MADSELLEGEVAVVTGGASGNGREIALTFAEEGADVVVADVNESPREGGVETHRRIREETDASAIHVDCDVSDVDDVYAAVEAAEEFGGVTVMVNNAGITESRSFLETTEDEYDTMMDVNAKGTFFGSQAAAKSMLDGGREGSIVNISSTSGLRGRADGVSYCTSKGGIRLMTYALADALAPDIRVNAVHPGFTDTAMTRGGFVDPDSRAEFFEKEMPLGRPGQPNDTANAVLYLASDLASFVTGHSLVVDGGVTATK
ncbi:SDR family oxidoreductase [Halopenitus salinus]|uniref:SDR family oxidoreductase n=1 Tax=Halopenitus salinus TaxID=1198295 RepID=A0ABD5UW77_9EURY